MKFLFYFIFKEALNYILMDGADVNISDNKSGLNLDLN
jgi:hypothetical protein